MRRKGIKRRDKRRRDRGGSVESERLATLIVGARKVGYQKKIETRADANRGLRMSK